MTLGCGGYGGNITSDNISTLHLLNIKRLAYDTRSTREPEQMNQSSRLLVNSQITPPKLDPQLIAERINSFLASRGLHVGKDEDEETSTTDNLSGAATETPQTDDLAHRPDAVEEEPTEDVVAVEFVAEDDVRRALQYSRQIVIDDKTIVTPAARDLAMDHGVFVDLSAGRIR